MGEFAEKLNTSLNNGDLTSKEVTELKKIVDITKENVVKTEFHEEFNKMVENYQSILKKQKVEPNVATKANIAGDKFMENITEADKLLEFIKPIIQNEIEINSLIKDTQSTIDYLLYHIEFDKSIMINKRIGVEDEKFKITNEQNLIEFKSVLLKIKDRFEKTYLLKL